MNIDVPCFFKMCNKTTEKECLDKELFGGLKYSINQSRSIDKGHIGFLYNPVVNTLMGVFVAEGPARMNIDPTAFEGKFPAQIKVKLHGKLQVIENAREKLSKILTLKTVSTKNGYSFLYPDKETHGPETTIKVLALFNELPGGLAEKVTEQFNEMGAIKVCEFDDIAGLPEVKQYIQQRIIEPFEDTESADTLGIRIGGAMLLFGPPGTGKTKIAIAISDKIKAKFYEITPSFIMGYPGEAEKRLEEMFVELRKQPRAVLFIDEAEWILAKRENQGSTVMQRIIPVLLAELSKFLKQKDKPIIIVAATNEPDAIDPAFLRPGRFDKIFYVGRPDEAARREIIKIYLKDRQNNISESEIADLSKLLTGFTGADIEHIIEEAAYIAFSRRNESDDLKIIKDDIIKAIKKTNPSVPETDIQKFRTWGNKRGINVNE
ncbi:MAG: AAA family ATPase [Bacteroidales bacterium]|nr:AAA family ATPase [Bacteroidales bacterium]